MLFATIAYNQSIADFENFTINESGFLNGSDLSGGFEVGNVILPNSFNVDYGSWSGWAITNHTDTSTPGFGNQYSSIVGTGNGGSQNYATTFTSGLNVIQLIDDAAGQRAAGIYVTNSTYAYLSMQDGDAFAKKFGGASGDDPDFFLLTIKGMIGEEVTADSIDFYLADYRFDDNAMDYLIDEWTYIDLYSLGEIDGISFSLSSSDNGQFGMNTPAYFCIDDIKTTDGITSTKNIEKSELKIYPNPVSDVVYISNDQNWENYRILDLNGRIIKEGGVNADAGITVKTLPNGHYVISVWNEDSKAVELFIKD